MTRDLLLMGAGGSGVTNTHSLDLEASSSQYASITDAAQTGLDITGDITIEAWIRPESQPATNTNFDIVCKWITGPSNAAYHMYYQDLSGTKSFALAVSDGTSSEELKKTQTFSNATWYHVAVVWDASTSTAEFFVDASSLGTATGSVTSLFNSSAGVLIGAHNSSSPSTFFDGLVDEVRIWNDKRTSTEISDNYQTELVGDEAGLVAYWKFNNSALDETSNNNDLTLNNSPVYSTTTPF